MVVLTRNLEQQIQIRAVVFDVNKLFVVFCLRGFVRQRFAAWRDIANVLDVVNGNVVHALIKEIFACIYRI